MTIVPSSLAVLALAGSGLTQLNSESQTGSLIPTRPQALSPGETARLQKAFARCVYHRAPAKAKALLDHSDPVTVDLAAAKIRDVNAELSLTACLGEEGRVDERALSLSTTTNSLRDMLAEEAYLASNKRLPVLRSPVSSLNIAYVSKGDRLKSAQSMTMFMDCTVTSDLTDADRLLRSTPGSTVEQKAAVALAPSLGRCLPAGQSFKLNAGSIRHITAYGMWSRFGRGAVTQ